MKPETEIRASLREWVLKNTKKTGLTEISDQTPLIENRIISSLQIMQLILFIEQLRGETFDLKKLKPGSFQSVDTIYGAFFGGAR